MKTRLRFSVCVAALVFLFVTAPRPAQAKDHCYACGMCYDHTWACTSCGVMALNAISGCCGFGQGSTYCVPDYGGFAVNCQNGNACQCGMAGDNCDLLMND